MTPGLGRELVVFLAAVLVGSLAGVVSRVSLSSWLGGVTATNVALAVATTCTGATHARLAHGQALPVLAAKSVVAAPLAYGVMWLVHRMLGA